MCNHVLEHDDAALLYFTLRVLKNRCVLDTGILFLRTPQVRANVATSTCELGSDRRGEAAAMAHDTQNTVHFRPVRGNTMAAACLTQG